MNTATPSEPRTEDRSNIADLLALKVGAMWRGLKAEPFAVWMIFCYFLFEYTRPQSIVPALDILPWMQVFILLSAAGFFFQQNKMSASGGAVLFWLVAFFVVIIISSQSGFAPPVSWRSLDKYYLWVIIFFLITRICTTERHFYFLLVIFFLASLKLSLFGARTWALRGFSFTSWGMKGPPGFFENSGELAVQMVVFFGISVYLYKALGPTLSGWRKWLLLAAPITAAMTVMAASSRGSQVALAVQLYLIFLHGKISIRALLIAGIVGYVAFSFLPPEQIERFTTIGEDKTSIQRMHYWENGWEMMKDYPSFGVGYFAFIPYFERFYPDYVLYDHAQLAHNIFIQVGADLGFIGLFVYLVLILLGFTVPRTAIKLLERFDKGDDWRVFAAKGLMLGFVGFLVGGQFVSIVYYPFMWMHLALSCVLLSSVRNQLAEELKPNAMVRSRGIETVRSNKILT
ncbi:MAG: O-antigen ligase family protein [Pseudomonadota bacterium]